MLRNGSFETGHYHPKEGVTINGWHYLVKPEDPEDPDRIMELQVPNEWDFYFADETVPNPIDSAPHSVFRRPEVRRLHKNDLPENERDVFVVRGNHTLKIFKGFGAWQAKMRQDVVLEKGVYTLNISVFNDAVQETVGGIKSPALDPKACMVTALINNKFLGWQSPFPLTMAQQKFYFSADGATKILIHFIMPYALENSGIFTDAWVTSLFHVCDGEIPTYPGLPRDQVEGTYILLPPTADNTWAGAATSAFWDDDRYTIGGFSDNAKRAIAVNPAEWTGNPEDLKTLFASEYTATEYKSVTAASAEEMVIKITAEDFDDPDVPPDPPDPPDPPAKTYTMMTYHQQDRVGGILDNLGRLHDLGHPMRWYKLVHTNMEMAREIKAVSPNTKVLYRYVDNDVGHYHNNSDVNAAVNEFLAHFWEGVLLNPIDAVESLNETIATHDYPGIMKTVAFDSEFAKEVYRRTNAAIMPVTLTAAPGNPDHGEEVEWLVPAARTTMQCGGMLGPHTYWPATPNRAQTDGWFSDASEYLHHQMRPLISWDTVFKQHGIETCYYFGESGPVAVHVRPDGSPNGFVGSGAGWKADNCLQGNLAWLLDMIITYQGQIEVWNAANNNRCDGFAFFTTKINGWDNFQFNEPEWNAMRARYEQYYAEGTIRKALATIKYKWAVK